MNTPLHHFVVLLPILSLVVHATAAELSVDVRDGEGRPARNLVVIATPKSAVTPPPRPVATVEMDQVDRQFSRYGLMVRAGTPVLFANNDSVAHQVYSFSPAKRFELDSAMVR